MIKDRHIGKFRIDRKTINNLPYKARHILRQVIVIKAEVEMAADAIEYTAISGEHFDPVPINCRAPYYFVDVSDDGDVEFEMSNES